MRLPADQATQQACQMAAYAQRLQHAPPPNAVDEAVNKRHGACPQLPCCCRLPRAGGWARSCRRAAAGRVLHRRRPRRRCSCRRRGARRGWQRQACSSSRLSRFSATLARHVLRCACRLRIHLHRRGCRCRRRCRRCCWRHTRAVLCLAIRAGAHWQPPCKVHVHEYVHPPVLQSKPVC